MLIRPQAAVRRLEAGKTACADSFSFFAEMTYTLGFAHFGVVINPSRQRTNGITKAKVKNKNTNRDTNGKKFKDSDVESVNSLEKLDFGIEEAWKASGF
ncbi:MAG: hypothetical protein LBC19_13110 [Tannerella sp.]|nr:hypothetical protein [Tannerella sp.]